MPHPFSHSCVLLMINFLFIFNCSMFLWVPLPTCLAEVWLMGMSQIWLTDHGMMQQCKNTGNYKIAGKYFRNLSYLIYKLVMLSGLSLFIFWNKTYCKVYMKWVMGNKQPCFFILLCLSSLLDGSQLITWLINALSQLIPMFSLCFRWSPYYLTAIEKCSK